MDGRAGRARPSCSERDAQPAARSGPRARGGRRRARRRARRSPRSRRVIVLGVLVDAAVVTSPGWPNVARDVLLLGRLQGARSPTCCDGFWLDVKLFVIVEMVVLVLALVVALARTTAAPALFPLRLVGDVFVDVMRGVPTILVVYLIGFGVPALQLSGLPTDPVVLGGIALTLSYSAYVAEVYRAGIESVHPSQRAAALAVGLTEGQAMRHVVLPQAVRRVVAAAAERLHLAAEGRRAGLDPRPLEAFRVAQIDASSNFNYTPLVAAALLYLCVTIPLARVVDRMGSARSAGVTTPRCSRSAASPRPTASARCCAASTCRCPSTRRSR